MSDLGAALRHIARAAVVLGRVPRRDHVVIPGRKRPPETGAPILAPNGGPRPLPPAGAAVMVRERELA